MSFITFVVAALVLALTPGPGIAYVVARTAAGGRAEGLASCIGTGLGGLLHVGAAALGLSLLVAQSAVAFNVIKWLGVIYLVDQLHSGSSVTWLRLSPSMNRFIDSSAQIRRVASI